MGEDHQMNTKKLILLDHLLFRTQGKTIFGFLVPYEHQPDEQLRNNLNFKTDWFAKNFQQLLTFFSQNQLSEISFIGLPACKRVADFIIDFVDNLGFHTNSFFSNHAGLTCYDRLSLKKILARTPVKSVQSPEFCPSVICQIPKGQLYSSDVLFIADNPHSLLSAIHGLDMGYISIEHDANELACLFERWIGVVERKHKNTKIEGIAYFQTPEGLSLSPIGNIIWTQYKALNISAETASTSAHNIAFYQAMIEFISEVGPQKPTKRKTKAFQESLSKKLIEVKLKDPPPPKPKKLFSFFPFF